MGAARPFPVTAESRGAVREVRTTHDEEYLYLRLQTDKPAAQDAGDRRTSTCGRARTAGCPDLAGAMPERRCRLPPRHATIRPRCGQAAWTDIRSPSCTASATSSWRSIARPCASGSGAWQTPRLILNRPFIERDTGVKHPTELVDIGRLRWGTANPKQRGFDDRVLVASKGAHDRGPPAVDDARPTPTRPRTRSWSRRTDGPVTSKRTGRDRHLDGRRQPAAAHRRLRLGGLERRRVRTSAARAAGTCWPPEFDRIAAPPKPR